MEAVTAARERSDRPPRWPTVAIRRPARRARPQSAPDERSAHNRRRDPPPGRGPLNDRRAWPRGGRLADGDCHPGAVASDRRRPLCVCRRGRRLIACSVPRALLALCVHPRRRRRRRTMRPSTQRALAELLRELDVLPETRASDRVLRRGGDRPPVAVGRWLREPRKGRKRPTGPSRSIRRPGYGPPSLPAWPAATSTSAPARTPPPPARAASSASPRSPRRPPRSCARGWPNAAVSPPSRCSRPAPASR